MFIDNEHPFSGGCVPEYPFPGGNVTFTPGKGSPPGSFIFFLPDGSEYLRIDPDGRAFVMGQLVDRNTMVWIAFKTWLHNAHVTLPDGPDGDVSDDLTVCLTPRKKPHTI
jgi:hypothetical protein